MQPRHRFIGGATLAIVGVVAIVWFVRVRSDNSDIVQQQRSRPSAVASPAADSIGASQGGVTSVTQSGLVAIVGHALLKHYADSLGGSLDDYSVADLVFNLQDESLPWAIRRRVAWELAKRGTGEAFTALTDLAGKAKPPLKAMIAEALGQCRHPGAENALLAMLQDKDVTVAQGSLRGLAGAGNSSVLLAVLRDANAPASLRATAAIGLGGSKNAEAVAALTQAYGEVADPELRAEILAGLGRQGGDAAAGFLQKIADDTKAPEALRVAAVEALGNGSAESSSMLLRYAGDTDPRVRAEAAWGLTMTEPNESTGIAVSEWLARETDPSVRSRIYQAMANHVTTGDAGVLSAVLGEKNAETRMAGLTWWAASARSDAGGALAQSFDLQAVPELWRTALSDAERTERLNAVIALRRAATPGALGALQDIAAQANNVQVVQAAQAALRLRK